MKYVLIAKFYEWTVTKYIKFWDKWTGWMALDGRNWRTGWTVHRMDRPTSIKLWNAKLEIIVIKHFSFLMPAGESVRICKKVQSGTRLWWVSIAVGDDSNDNIKVSSLPTHQVILSYSSSHFVGPWPFVFRPLVIDSVYRRLDVG